MLRRFWQRLRATLRRDFFAGLLVFIPIGFTILGVLWIIEQLDKLVLPKIFGFFDLEPDQLPFVGVAVTLGVILLAGALTRSFVGRSVLRLWERLVDRIPIARSMYAVLKQSTQALFGDESKGRNFRRVVLIQYPRQGIYTYAFVTGQMPPTAGLPGGLIKIFVPSTPNPTTGYFLMLPEADVIDTGLSVEEAFKLIISAGIVTEEPKLPPAKNSAEVLASLSPSPSSADG